MASLCARLPEVRVADFAEVTKFHIFGIIPHPLDYLLYRFHTPMVSLLLLLFKKDSIRKQAGERGSERQVEKLERRFVSYT